MQKNRAVVCFPDELLEKEKKMRQIAPVCESGVFLSGGRVMKSCVDLGISYPNDSNDCNFYYYTHSKVYGIVRHSGNLGNFSFEIFSGGEK